MNANNKTNTRSMMTLPLAAAAVLLLFGSAAEAGPRFIWTNGARDLKLMSAPFARKLCAAWNSTALPRKLGRSGSKWIDSAKSKGRQVIVISRRDCKGWKKVQLVIEADGSGQARCVSGGAFKGGKYQWKFEPTTEHWADFTDGFGAMKMPKIMKGFVGPYGTAMKNIGNFELFFAAAGNLAIKTGATWYCAGADRDDVKDEIKDIDLKDMKKILRKK